MFIRKNKIIIIILQPVDGATDGATRRVICPTSFCAMTMKCNEKAVTSHHLEVNCVVVEGGRDAKHSAAVGHVTYVCPSATEKHVDVING